MTEVGDFVITPSGLGIITDTTEIRRRSGSMASTPRPFHSSTARSSSITNPSKPRLFDRSAIHSPDSAVVSCPIGHKTASLNSPIFSYPYARTRHALARLPSAGEPDVHHGYRMRDANPVHGGWAMPTIAPVIQLFPAGFSTQAISFWRRAGVRICRRHGPGRCRQVVCQLSAEGCVHGTRLDAVHGAHVGFDVQRVVLVLGSGHAGEARHLPGSCGLTPIGAGEIRNSLALIGRRGDADRSRAKKGMEWR